MIYDAHLGELNMHISAFLSLTSQLHIASVFMMITYLAWNHVV
jgi:hypothetical protein